ncbi:PTS sugar transporter subunit IIB [Oceanobacillus jeddahense]|uniref:PTS sugar transporter subunit IIB n=1 Tax=Oceanobacillus jeddahense TaxID=1462527 RepID=A0ABY5JMP4_9BACI|nr:PTS sugar transporter subunit IIB [Oceanobacillus jeddahense]UUI01084.1 PTS sugar transporter subunit IIB [Oceanobacillus jeddahense]
MIKIGLFCFAGMSTSVLVTRMEKFASEHNLDCTVEAYSETEVTEKVKDLDIVLIGPQIKYYKKRIEGICEPYGVKTMVISNAAFGRMDAQQVITEAYALLGKDI